MQAKSEITELNEISDVFVMFGLATLFAAVCPIIAFIVLLHNLIAMKMDLYSSYSFH
jgi:hypothetical protein